jgi:hypothetical protein
VTGGGHRKQKVGRKGKKIGEKRREKRREN